ARVRVPMGSTSPTTCRSGLSRTTWVCRVPMTPHPAINTRRGPPSRAGAGAFIRRASFPFVALDTERASAYRSLLRTGSERWPGNHRHLLLRCRQAPGMQEVLAAGGGRRQFGGSEELGERAAQVAVQVLPQLFDPSTFLGV